MEEAQLGLEEVGPSSTPPRAVPAKSMPPTSMPQLPICVCGMKTVMIASWTAQNPGRRFAKCALGEPIHHFLTDCWRSSKRGLLLLVGENSGKILHSGLWQGVPRESRGTITDATFSCDGIYVFASLEDGSIFVLTSVKLEPWCQINPTSYLPFDPSSTRLHPLAIDAHPLESNQFAVGLTDGGVCIVEPPYVLVLWMWHAAFKR